MGIGFPTPTTIIAADVNVHNYDASIGQKTTSESLAVVLSAEQQAILQAISDALGASAGGFNAFDTKPAASGSWITVLSKSIVSGEKMCVKGFVVWGDADAEWSLEKSSTQIGGIRTAPSALSRTVKYDECIEVVGPDTVTIKVRHWYTGHTGDFYANLEGRIV
jgi:hypothetical protein